jgi:hypothetical protein
MGLPTIEKSWQFNVNQLTGLSGVVFTDLRQCAYTFKESLKTFGSNPWTVVSSSDGSTTFGAGDNWTSPGVLGLSNYSWIRLKQTAISANFEVLFVFGHQSAPGNPGYCTFYYSLLGFTTGGTLLARPTATDEQVIDAAINSGFCGVPSASARYVHHAMQSSDGEVTYYVMCCNGFPVFWFCAQKPKNPVAGFTTPHLVGRNGYGISNPATNIFTYNLFRDTTYHRFTYTAVRRDVFLSNESYNTGANARVVNALTGGNQIVPVGIVSNSPLGRHAEMWDFWQTASVVGTGDTFPASGTKQLAVFGAGEIVLPWNGSTPVIT